MITKFEDQQKYELSRKAGDFIPSRETGRLRFLVENPSSATPYRIKPLPFQTKDIPETLHVVYRKDQDVLEQDMDRVRADFYKPGQELTLRVLNRRADGKTVLTDDDTGMIFPYDFGKERPERGERIQCSVKKMKGGNLTLECKPRKKESKQYFKLEELLAPQSMAWLRHLDLKKALATEPLFADVRAMIEAQDSAWAERLVETAVANLPAWLSADPRRRSNLAGRLRDSVISLIEDTNYLQHFPLTSRDGRIAALSRAISNFDNYATAVNLMLEHREEDFISHTIASLRRQGGWLYSAEEKMRTLMALFRLRPEFSHAYIADVFKIIKENRSDIRFMEVFGKVLKVMLKVYITNESKYVNPYNRDALRELIEAVAIELLLTQDEEYDLWVRHRALLYGLSALLTRTAQGAVVEKAMLTTLAKGEEPLEFGWDDLEDIARMCFQKLARPWPAEDKRRISVFEGERVRLRAIDAQLNLSATTAVPPLKTGFTRELAPGIPLNVLLADRCSEKAPANPMDLPRTGRQWAEATEALLAKREEKKTAKPKVVRKSAPAKGAQLTAVVTGRIHEEDETNIHFACRIEDPHYEGYAEISVTDIVQYPLGQKMTTEPFTHEGRPLLLPATVKEIRDDGTAVLSMRDIVNEISEDMANDDLRDDVEDIMAVVTKVLGPDQYLALTEYGYPVGIRSDVDALRFGQTVMVRIDKVPGIQPNGQLKVYAKVERTATPEETQKFYHDYVFGCFNQLMCSVANGRTLADETGEGDDHTMGSEEVGMLTAADLAEVSRLLGWMAAIARHSLPRAYDLLQAARLLAVTAGDDYATEYLGVKIDQLEALADFALNGRIEASGVERLKERARALRTNDAELLHIMQLLDILARLDRAYDHAADAPNPADDESLATLRRLVNAYNLMRGATPSIASVRRDLREQIFGMLNIEMPKEDIDRLNVKEDRFNEFKTSLIYPAGNSMHAAPDTQVREIVEGVDAFLNTDGGTLHLGVDNQGYAKGLHNDFTYLNHGYDKYDLTDVRDKFNLLFFNGMRRHLGLMSDGRKLEGEYVKLEHETINGKHLCHIVVKPFPGLVELRDGMAKVRNDASSVNIPQADRVPYAKRRQKA